MNLKNKIVSIGSLRSCDPGTEKQHSETTRCRETGTFQGLRCYPPWNWRETLGLEDAFPFWKGLFFRGKIAVSGRVTIGKKWTGFLQAEEAKLERRELQEQETRHEVRPPVIQPGSGGGCLFGILLFIPFFYYKTNKNQMKHMKEWVLCIYYVLGIHGFNSCDFPCPGVCFLGGSGRREGKRSKKNWMKFRRDARSLRKLCPNAFHCCCCCPMIRCEESGAHVTCMFFLASMWHALLYFLAWHRLRMLVADDCWSTSPWIRERCHAAGDQVPWRDSTWHLELEKNAERKTCFLLWFADPLNSFSYSLHIFSAEETAWNCNIN